MVDYQYRDLFYKSNQTKDILIVDSGATVTSVSESAPTVTDATIEIHTEDIESESFALDESICSEDNLHFGLCESAGVSFTIKNKADIPNLKRTDDLLFLNIYTYFNGDSDTLFQIGQYVCDKDSYVSNRKKRDIALYDILHTLYSQDITSWYNSYFETATSTQKQIIYVIANLFNWINKSGTYANDDTSPNIPIELDSNYTLTNGTFQIGKTIESDTVTFGMLMEGLLEFNGCFGHINRQGKFQIVMMAGLDSDFVRTVTDDYRIPPTNYDDVNTWGIGQIDVYGRDNTIRFTVQNTNKKEPSIYVMADPWILADREAGDSTVITALNKLLTVINHYNYNPSETECSGDLCVEVGDRIKVSFTAEPEDTRSWYRSYVLERHFIGIQSMRDTYTAKGDKKQPKYQVTNDLWHVGDSQTGTTGSGTGGVAEVIDEIDNKIIEIMRNYGLRVLDEPKVTLEYNKSSQQVEIKWEDPDDLERYRPVPLDWAGTIVVRKEGEKPLNRWNGNADGNTLVDSTTRDEYKTTAFVDNTIEQNKRYYYAIMPYHIALDDNDHPIKHYRWTKVFSVDTAKFLVAPTIFPITVIEGTEMTIAYSIPVLESGSYAVQKLVGKKNSIPTSKTDGTVLVDLNPTSGQIVNYVTVTGLDEESTYYFVIFIEDTDGNSASSEPQDATTGVDLGWNFDYTGAIQTFTAPKTGIYSLETWGAQGGEATDGTNTARGGYGAYAYGEVRLTQGTRVYISVGANADHSAILWNDDLQIRHSMTYDFVSYKANTDAYNWEFQNTYNLVGSGANNGNGNASIVFQKGIKRKNATKLYVEVSCSEAYHGWNGSAMQLANTKNSTGYLPSGYKRVDFVVGSSSGPTDNYTHTTPYGTFTKILAEIDISSVDPNTAFYLAFWKCNEKTTITKCYFDAEVEIEI